MEACNELLCKMWQARQNIKALIIGSNSSHVKRTALKILLPVVLSVLFFRGVYFKPIVTQFVDWAIHAS